MMGMVMSELVSGMVKYTLDLPKATPLAGYGSVPAMRTAPSERRDMVKLVPVTDAVMSPLVDARIGGAAETCAGYAR